jgi:hypothetical protein
VICGQLWALFQSARIHQDASGFPRWLLLQAAVSLEIRAEPIWRWWVSLEFFNQLTHVISKGVSEPAFLPGSSAGEQP